MGNDDATEAALILKPMMDYVDDLVEANPNVVEMMRELIERMKENKQKSDKEAYDEDMSKNMELRIELMERLTDSIDARSRLRENIHELSSQSQYDDSQPTSQGAEQAVS